MRRRQAQLGHGQERLPPGQLAEGREGLVRSRRLASCARPSASSSSGLFGSTETAVWALAKACSLSFARRYSSIWSRRGDASAGIGQDRLVQQAGDFVLACAAGHGELGQGEQAGLFFGFATRRRSNRWRASSGFFSAMSSVARRPLPAK